ncbi:MAG: APC family permease [Balneolaceae bacterium]|nr:APC family permease [Balneolaceae bacterium]
MGSDNSNKLSLFDACAMAIGGMVGGGIFAVLGEAVSLSGNSAFLSFGIGGMLALITGIVYSKLTVKFDEPGGSFSFMEHFTGAGFAGTVSWFLLLGYVFTVSLYAYTFGAYAARLFGLSGRFQFLLGALIIVLLTVLNLIGVRESGVSEDILVYGKVVILTGLVIIGFFAIEPDQMLPVISKGPGNMIIAGALVFVAYEGFQLLTYDYEDIADHERNLPKAIYISIPVVIALYMLISFVLTGSVAPEVIMQNKETALAELAQPILGRFGVVIVLVAAVLSTSSAILATIFAVARLARRIAQDGQLPGSLTKKISGGIPVYFTVLIAILAIVIQFFGNLHQITTYSSLVFLIVFSVVNYIGYHIEIFSGWKNLFPLLGSAGCIAAMAILIYNTFATNLATLYIIAGITLLVLVLRWLYTRFDGN